MRVYPAMLNLSDKPCLVVGGGKIAERKIALLLQSGARITVVSPQSTNQISQWSNSGQLHLIQRPFHPEDVEGASLIIAATNDPDINLKVFECITSFQWINIVDRPDLSTFLVPSVIKRGDLQIAVSTGGNNPGLARKIKQGLEGILEPEYEEYVQFLGMARRRVLELKLPPRTQKELLKRLLDDCFLEYSKQRLYPERDEKLIELISRYRRPDKGVRAPIFAHRNL